MTHAQIAELDKHNKDVRIPTELSRTRDSYLPTRPEREVPFRDVISPLLSTSYLADDAPPGDYGQIADNTEPWFILLTVAGAALLPLGRALAWRWPRS
jgi:hypothetical protein